MKPILFAALALSYLSGNPLSSADLQKGFEAYNRGDYSTALKEFRALAEQGNVDIHC